MLVMLGSIGVGIVFGIVLIILILNNFFRFDKKEMRVVIIIMINLVGIGIFNLCLKCLFIYFFIIYRMMI